MARTYYEVHVAQVNGFFTYTVTVTVGRDHWTSKPVALEATDWDSAQAEAIGRVRRFAEIQREWGNEDGDPSVLRGSGRARNGGRQEVAGGGGA